MATKRQSPDPILQEIYAIREQISAECGHDMRKIYEYFKRKRASAKRKPARGKAVRVRRARPSAL